MKHVLYDNISCDSNISQLTLIKASVYYYIYSD